MSTSRTTEITVILSAPGLQEPWLNVGSRNLGSRLHFRRKELWCIVCIQNYQSCINLLTGITDIYLISFSKVHHSSKATIYICSEILLQLHSNQLASQIKSSKKQSLFQINFSTFFSVFMKKKITSIWGFLLVTQVKISTPIIYIHSNFEF